MSKRDFQKSLIYAWENSRFTAVSKKNLTIEECTALVNDACRCYGIHAPKIVFPEGYQARTAHYAPGKCEIVLPDWSRHRHYLIHELSHHICCVKGNDGVSHGKKYFSIYAYLLNQYGAYPLHEVFFKASKMGIKYTNDFPKFVEGMVPSPELVVPYS